MPNLAAVLRSEVLRLARKAAKEAVQPAQRSSSSHRKQIAAMRRQIAALEREVRTLRASGLKTKAAPPTQEPDRPLRFVTKGLVSLRTRLDLSAADFGKLVGVSGQTIYSWEQGKSTPRSKQLAALSQLRGIGKKEAAARLAA